MTTLDCGSARPPRGGSNAAALRRRFAVGILAQEILRDAATALAPHAIPVMPLKGVLFQRFLYDDPAERLVSDVDVLVPEQHFEAAIRALLGAGFKPQKVGRSLIEIALLSPKGLAVDLHRRLFGTARYGLSSAGVFRRSSRNEDWLGVPVQIAHPHDTAAHLVGKFVSDHVVAESRARLEELLRWVKRFELEPPALTRHLEACGMRRAARYTFVRGQQITGEGFFDAGLAALQPDPVGRLCARLAESLIPRWQRRRLAPVPAHLLNASLPQAVASGTCAMINRHRHARWVRDRATEALATGLPSPFGPADGG